MPKNIKLKLDDKNVEILEKIKDNSKVPITRIINILISSMDMDIDFINNTFSNEKETVLKVKITESEKEFLQAQALKSGANSLSAEIKYRLLNTIYKNKYFTNNEMKDFVKSRYEINMVGLNLNQLLKQIYTKDDYKLDKDELKKLILDVASKIEEHNKELAKVLTYTNDRF